jgi:ribosome biogenesis GTPase
MKKRSLTGQQQQRISEKHRAIVHGNTQSALVIARYGKRAEIEDINHTIYRCHLRQNLGHVVVGDYVVWEWADDEPVITAIQPRNSVIMRYNKFEGNKPVAANLDQLMIVVASEPHRALNVLDRYLLLAELQKIPAIIIFNKIDLLPNIAELKKGMQMYEALGYNVFYTSTRTNEGLDEFKKILLNKKSVFCGISGVGKSSLLNYYLPHATIEIGELSEKTREGNHTTTTARLYHLSEGGEMIDCPGIRELSFGDLPFKSIEQGFKEIHNVATDCKFRDCTHDHEPDCAVIKSLEAGTINEARFASFRSLCNAQ